MSLICSSSYLHPFLISLSTCADFFLIFFLTVSHLSIITLSSLLYLYIFLFPSSSLFHLSLFSSWSLPHLFLISVSSFPHDFLITSSSLLHYFLFSSSLLPLLFLIFLSSPSSPHHFLNSSSSLSFPLSLSLSQTKFAPFAFRIPLAFNVRMSSWAWIPSWLVTAPPSTKVPPQTCCARHRCPLYHVRAASRATNPSSSLYNLATRWGSFVCNEGSSISSSSLTSSLHLLLLLVVDLRWQLHSGRLSGGFRWTTDDAAGQLQAKKTIKMSHYKLLTSFGLETAKVVKFSATSSMGNSSQKLTMISFDNETRSS